MIRRRRMPLWKLDRFAVVPRIVFVVVVVALSQQQIRLPTAVSAFFLPQISSISHKQHHLGRTQRLLLRDSREKSESDFITVSNAQTTAAEVSSIAQKRRRRALQRRPRFYWSKPENLRCELVEFWNDRGVVTASVVVAPTTTTKKGTGQQQPLIPNEMLLYYFERHDIRAAIVRLGGRVAVSEMLGGAAIMPGRWTEAVETCPELQFVIARDPRLRSDRSPRGCIYDGEHYDDASQQMLSDGKKMRRLWEQKESRNKKGYWSLQLVIEVLYVAGVYHTILSTAV
jgi:hypothetical protein